MRFSFFLLLCFFSLNHHFLSAQWLPATGNSGFDNTFNDLLITDYNRIIATQSSNYSEPGGSIYSDDGGRTWRPLKERPTGNQLRLRLLGKQGNKLFGTSNTGIWTSTDNGDSWQLSPTSGPVYYTKFKASDKCAVFVSDEYNAGLSISLNSGRTWTSTRIEASAYITGLDVRSDTVFVSCRYGGLYKGNYVNNKWTWVNISAGNDVTDIATISSDAYIITNSNQGGVIFRNGVTEKFTLINRDGGTERQFEDVYVLGNYWVITTNRVSGKIFVSGDQGKNWKDFSGGLPKPYISETSQREVVISDVAVLKDTLYALIGQGLMKRPLKELAANYLEVPTNLKIDTTKRNTHIIKWTDNSSTETGFVIERSENGVVFFQEVAYVPENAESYTDFDIPGGKTYYYRIKSYYKNTSSRYSDILIVKREADICKVNQKVIYTSGPSYVKFINEKTGFWLKSNFDEGAFLLRTDDGGVSWNEVPFHMNIPSGSQINFLDDKVGFIYHFPSFSDEYWKFMTIDGGVTWRKVDNNHRLFMEKYKIFRKTIPSDQFFINDSTGFQVNNRNTSFARTGDYGRSWIPLKLDPDPNNWYEYVEKIFFTDNKNGFAIYSGKISRTTDGGDSWAPATLPQPFYDFVDIYSPDKKTVYFIGSVNDYSNPAILKTSDNGRTFESIQINLKNETVITSISFVGNKAWISTNLGELYVSNDDLKTWQILSEQVNFYRSLTSFKGKWGIAGTDFHAANKNRFMAYMTYDGGRSWKDINFPSKITNSYGMAPKVKVFDDNKAIVLIEDILYKTEDRGKTWTTKEQPFNQKSGGFIYNFYPVSEKVWFLNHRFNNEDYKLYRTTDGGDTWQYLPQVLNPFDGFYFFDSKVGFVKGNGTGWFRTTDGGDTWTKFYGGNDSFFYPSGVWFTDTKTGFMAGGGATENGYASKILKTKDSGATWEEIVLDKGIKDKPGLDKIKFLNEKVGYVTSRDDIIKTSDGGLTWTITTYDKFFNEYASLIDFDEYYSYYGSDMTSRLYHFAPDNAAAKPHQPNGDIDACLYTNAATLYTVDNNDSYSYQWKVSASGIMIAGNRNEISVKWNQSGTFNVSVRAISNCGVSDWQEMPVTVNSLAAKPALTSGSLTPCPQTNQIYQLNNTSGYTYEWIIPASISKTINKNSVNINWAQENKSFVLKAVANNGVCPSDTLSFEVKTRSFPAIPTITKGATTLTSSSVFNNQWFFADMPITGAVQQTLSPEQTGMYSVQVSNECGARKSEAVYVFVQILATEEEKEETVMLYPNPVANDLVIKSKQYPIESVYLYDSNGRILRSMQDKSVGEYKINVTDLNSGVYLIKILSNNQVINRKVIIHR
jgi:photosystem II stability/assembly factor-like uncharacterized protein